MLLAVKGKSGGGARESRTGRRGLPDGRKIVRGRAGRGERARKRRGQRRERRARGRRGRLSMLN